MQAAIDTGKVQNRRALRFNSIDEALADVDRLAEAERAGRLVKLGNWPLGQSLGHLATWTEFCFTGTPLQPPWFVKAIVRLRKKKYLTGQMPAGVKIPRVPNGTLGTEAMSTEQALARYRAVMERLRGEAPTMPNVIFGPLNHDEWIQLSLRHAELHLSFLQPQ
jgi:hypothetical protein